MIRCWDKTCSVSDFAELWNRSACTRHGFYPLTPSIVSNRIIKHPRFRPERLMIAFDKNKMIGLCHHDIVREPYYDAAGVIEVILVDPSYRRNGIGSLLMNATIDKLRSKKNNIKFIDGLGGWPYCPMYACLINGSEPSGVENDDRVTFSFFESFGFQPDRKSFIMQRRLNSPLPERPLETIFTTATDVRPGGESWLDECFSGWKLQNHYLLIQNTNIVSRAIFSRMVGLSTYTGIETYSLFGVHTPEPLRGRGLAKNNLINLLYHIKTLGGELVELHVYTDNFPAVRLYESIGFEIVGETTLLRLRMSDT